LARPVRCSKRWRRKAVGYEFLRRHVQRNQLVLGAVVLVALLSRQKKTGSNIAAWILAIAGVLIGVGGLAAAFTLLGYEPYKQPGDDAAGGPPSGTAQAPAGGGMGGGGMGGIMGGGGMGGMMGGGMGEGGRGGRGPSPKRDLTTLVGKLNLLTGDISLDLNEAQITTVVESLAEIENAESMTDEQAKEKYDALIASLTDEQKAKLEQVALPFAGRGGGFGGGGFGGGGGRPGGPPGRPPMEGGSGAPAPAPGGPPPGGGAAAGGPMAGVIMPVDESNPFSEEANQKVLEQLRKNLAPAGS
jgi:hypothetical protein